MVKNKKNIQASFLGKIDYFEAIKLQEKINLLVQKKEQNEHILFLEHDNVVTFGSQEKISEIEIERLNLSYDDILFVKSSRGGQITAHNPGQIICYPIINIKNYFSGILEYVEFLERVIIETLSKYKLFAHTVKKRRGIWINGDPNEKYDEDVNPKGQKIAAIGLKIIKNISMHGFALNINNDMSIFKKITPCGMPNLEISSLSNITGKKYNLEDISLEIIDTMNRLLNSKIKLEIN
ncbi:MAG: lipoyl(octanoyl) transferase LipB [Dehalococcoidia bacterium]|nr:lipoyl(octanoyl) transferase LipB [Dehalococcoidia bacterium]